MAKKIISLYSPHAIGFTFLSWSLHFLAGHKETYHSKTDRYHNLPENPLTDVNSHGFKKNHPSGFQETEGIIKNLPATANFVSLYPTPCHADYLSDSTDPVQIASEYQSKLLPLIKNDTKKLFNLCSDSGPLVYSRLTNTNRTFLLHARSNDRAVFENKKGTWEPPDIVSDRLFFKESADFYESNNMTKIWDLRERLALNMKLVKENVDSEIDLSVQHYYIDPQDLWYNLDTEIEKIFNYIEEKIDNDRYQAWLPVFRQWSQIQKNNSKFELYLDHIIDCIVYNYYFDLGRFNLSLVQEACIQHILIYKHNLTIKNWNLNRFPSNTKDLHQLLEINFHQLGKS